jgi:hypothetical protein
MNKRVPAFSLACSWPESAGGGQTDADDLRTFVCTFGPKYAKLGL